MDQGRNGGWRLSARCVNGRRGRARADGAALSGRETEPLPGAAGLRALVRANPGDWFARTEIGRDILRIEALYRDAGYPSVAVEPELDASREEAGIVDMTIAVRPGPRAR